MGKNQIDANPQTSPLTKGTKNGKGPNIKVRKLMEMEFPDNRRKRLSQLIFMEEIQ